jgi:hypothetical protein
MRVSWASEICTGSSTSEQTFALQNHTNIPLRSEMVYIRVVSLYVFHRSTSNVLRKKKNSTMLSLGRITKRPPKRALKHDAGSSAELRL